MDTIFVRAIEFYGYHGASDEEQVVGHRYLVDVDLRYCTRRAGNSDKLQDTINYSRVAKRIVEIGAGERYRLLEALASRLAEVLLAEFPMQSIRLRVIKKCPPMNVIASEVGIEIERER